MAVAPNNLASTTTRFPQMQGARRNYRVHGGGTVVSIEDGTSPYLEALAMRFPDLTDRALRHMAWWLRGVIKQEMRAGAPGGRPWNRTAGMTKFRVLEAFKKRVGSHGRQPVPAMLSRFIVNRKTRGAWPEAGNLTNAVGYEHKRPLTVSVGWLSRSASRLGVIFQGGQTTSVTKKMRYLFIAAGIPLKKGKKLLVQPARPVFEPVYSARNREIRDRIEARIDLYLHELGLQYQLRAG